MLGSDIMVTGMVCTGLDMVTIMASVRLRLNLRLTQPFFMAPMGMVVSDTMDMLDWVTMVMLGSHIMVTGMVCTGLDMVTIMASVRQRLNLRLTQPFFMVPTGMVVSDTMDMLDWVTMAMLGILAMAMVSMVSAMLTTMESARLKQSLRLRLTLPYFTAPMAMVLVTMAMLGWDI